MQGVRRWLLCNAPVAALCALTASAAGLMPGVAAAHSHAVVARRLFEDVIAPATHAGLTALRLR